MILPDEEGRQLPAAIAGSSSGLWRYVQKEPVDVVRKSLEIVDVDEEAQAIQKNNDGKVSLLTEECVGRFVQRAL